MANKQNQWMRKKTKMLITGKLLASVYLIVFTAGYLTAGTGAYFNDAHKETQVIQAGTWWDGSDLAFNGQPVQASGDNCPGTVNVTLQNNGKTMLGPAQYSVYYSKEGNPKNGKVIKEGKIKPLQADGAVTLNYGDAAEGVYVFKAVQRPGYQDHHEKPPEFWSGEITVACADKNEQTNKDEDQKKDRNKQAETKQNASDKKTAENQEQEKDESNGKTETHKPDSKQSNQKPQVKDETDTANENTGAQHSDESTDKQSPAKKQKAQQQDETKQAPDKPDKNAEKGTNLDEPAE
ncbi:hypothetical protein GCM10007063_20700 [Lentibacillus kapialis]|uniref:Amyloid fiber anchoring/assembly protein TapA n=1 Tax=Lentibacillus kapialis TaxID=340214 RepID=A0A917PXS8_9BACI|nr:amyloid fiber anchoring/assembly protein TapA [Lentibacillus kapialis]GGJ98229.1 hypothetical protein GCM10007063_20700 [Lentibacillus kapialis]